MAKIVPTKNSTEFHKTLLAHISESAQQAISERGKFLIGVSGGSCVRFLISVLKEIKSDLSKWRFFFCDERVVPENDPDSTYGAYRKALDMAKIDVPDSQFVCIKQGVSAEEAAKDYLKKVEKYFPDDTVPKFDLLMLGMGPDGHTCSLFPRHKLLTETAFIAPITDSPKPPSSRITLTLPVINNSRKVVFAVAGADKAPIVKKIFVDQDKTSFPAAQVNIPEKVFWILDENAASELNK